MIWLIGCNGNLGSEIARLLEKRGVAFLGTDSSIDISDFTALKAYAAGKHIDWIINCAAYTEVDRAEDEKERAFLVNETGARNCACMARETGAGLIHVSTDYVFGGAKPAAGDGGAAHPLSEDEPVAPLSVYGASKAAGERAVRDELTAHYILRTSGLYGREGRNFVRTMLRLLAEKPEVRVVDDQTVTPTAARNLAEVILRIIEKDNVPYGTYNCTDSGFTTWYGFACAIREEAVKRGLLADSCTTPEPCSTEDFAARARRPSYSVLSKEKLLSVLGVGMPVWRESLCAFLEDLCGN